MNGVILTTSVSARVHALPLVDHHVHSVLDLDLDLDSLAQLLTESDVPAPAGTSHLDSQVGFAMRRHCAPLLGLAPHASLESYAARRSELGHAEVDRRLLRASGVTLSLVETGIVGRSDELASPAVFAERAGHEVREVIRLESVAEQLLNDGVSASGFPDAMRAAIENRPAGAVGFKSIVAYRHGFRFDPARPSDEDVVHAVSLLSRDLPHRLSDPTVIRFLLWLAVDTGLPIQLHTGYGDADLDLVDCNPALLMPWLRAIPQNGSPIMLLHCYPYHREAGYLAQVFPHVYFDVGLGVNYSGAASVAVIREAFELAPFGKLLYSSDAWGVPELHLLGAQLWRDGLGRVLDEFVQQGAWLEADALRVARLVCSENAIRAYRL